MTPHPAIDALRPPEGVTPGPWRHVRSDGCVIEVDDWAVAVTYVPLDATHIANMDPATTDALLDVVELLLTALDELTEDHCAVGGWPLDASDDCLCAHHWALKRKAEALALLDTLTPRDEETDRD